MNEFWALVPVKRLAQSKHRLAAVLAPSEREQLVLAMLRDVLTAIQGTPALDGVLLVTRSLRARALARDFVTETFEESASSDHSMAVVEGNRYLVDRHGIQGSLVISSDVPSVTTKDIDQILAHHDCVTLVPNASGEGTNAILTSPPNAIICQFGGGSLERHVALANAAGVSASIVHNSNVALDIDGPHDLMRALKDLPESFTRDYLESRGFAARLEDMYLAGALEHLQMPITVDYQSS